MQVGFFPVGVLGNPPEYFRVGNTQGEEGGLIGWEFYGVEVIKVGVVWVEIFLDGRYTTWELPGWELFRVRVLRLGIVRVGIAQGEICYWWEFYCQELFINK